MNSQMKWFVSWGLGGSWEQELLFLWSWGESPSLCECLHQPGSSLNPLLLVFCGCFLTRVCVCVCVCSQLLSPVQLFATPWTVACQAPLSMGFSRQEYWSGLLFPPGDLPHLGVKPVSPASPALTSGFFTTELPGKPHSSSRHEQVITPLPSMKDGR